MTTKSSLELSDLEVWRQAYNTAQIGAVIAQANGMYWAEEDTCRLADQALAAYKNKMTELLRKETSNETHVQQRITNQNPDRST